MRRTQHLENFLQELRYAIRMLGKNPTFAVVIVSDVRQKPADFRIKKIRRGFATLSHG